MADSDSNSGFDHFYTAPSNPALDALPGADVSFVNANLQDGDPFLDNSGPSNAAVGGSKFHFHYQQRLDSSTADKMTKHVKFCDDCQQSPCTGLCKGGRVRHRTLRSYTFHKHIGFPFLKLPAEMRLDTYDMMCREADECFPTDMASVVHGMSGGVTTLLLKSTNIKAIVRIIKGPYTELFASLMNTNQQLQREVGEYILNANIRRTKDFCVSVIWFEDLGHFLTKLGSMGRQHLTSLKFTWDNKERGPNLALMPTLWRSEEGPEKIFNMLALCKNLQDLNVRMDIYRLIHFRPDGTWRGQLSFDSFSAQNVADIRGMKELSGVKVKRNLTLQYTDAQATPGGLLDRMKSEMADFSNEDDTEGDELIGKEYMKGSREYLKSIQMQALRAQDRDCSDMDCDDDGVEDDVVWGRMSGIQQEANKQQGSHIKQTGKKPVKRSKNLKRKLTFSVPEFARVKKRASSLPTKARNFFNSSGSGNSGGANASIAVGISGRSAMCSSNTARASDEDWSSVGRLRRKAVNVPSAPQHFSDDFDTFNTFNNASGFVNANGGAVNTEGSMTAFGGFAGNAHPPNSNSNDSMIDEEEYDIYGQISSDPRRYF